MNNTVTEFQVVEWYDSDQKKVWKVELQYRQVIYHNSSVYSTGPWVTVPRNRMYGQEIK